MITVLMAVWQGVDYLCEQLDSILTQTRPVDRIVISDDGSTDGTLDILTAYQSKYPDVVEVISHADGKRKETLRGAAANFFFLIERERLRMKAAAVNYRSAEPLNEQQGAGNEETETLNGYYWFLSDQDDIWMPDKVEKMCGKMAEEEGLVGHDTAILLYSDVKVVDKSKKVLSESLFRYQRMNPERVEFSEVLVENPVTGGAAMFNAALLGQLSEPPETCVMHDWWLALLAASFGKIICLEETLSLYRQHGHNNMGASQTGSFKDLKARLGRSQDVQDNYRRMFAQAECFLLQYGSRMPVSDRRTLQGYLSLVYRSPLRRFRVIRKYSLYKSSLVQTLAQCLTIKR